MILFKNNCARSMHFNNGTVTVGPGRNDRRPGDKGLSTKSLAYRRDESQRRATGDEGKTTSVHSKVGRGLRERLTREGTRDAIPGRSSLRIQGIDGRVYIPKGATHGPSYVVVEGQRELDCYGRSG